jgi:diguanylate cyclase (GGDEF)-like protein
MFRRLARSFSTLEAERGDQRRLILLFNATALIVAIASAPLIIDTSVRYYYLGFVGALLVSMYFAFRNRLWFPKYVLPVLGFLFVTRLVYGGGIHDDAIGGYYFLLVFAGMVLDRRALLVTGAMNTLAILLIGAAETSGVIETRFGPLTERLTIVTSAAFMLGTTFALNFLVARLNRALANARGKERAQIEANRELRDLKIDLERRVELRTTELDLANQQLQIQLEHINRLKAKLQEEAIRDPLTGLFNRRYLNEMLPVELARGERAKIAITILVIDIDHFKSINDTHGHQVGDHVLRDVGGLLKANIRAGDIVCRYGGEEFLMVMPGMREGDARRRAEKLRLLIESHSILQNGVTIKLTASIGGAVYPEHGVTQDQLISLADSALYRAKHSGRNRVEFPIAPVSPG